MTRLLTGIKASSRKTFLMWDQSNLVEIKQPDFMGIAFLYSFLLEKQTNLNIIDKKLDLFFNM